ncbi:MAG TPA: GTPase HflX [Armatimonadota bacterium]|jgi:GTP-binding protein HflX|nr:GTPase HflX [Armatimonadota bacterium]
MHAVATAEKAILAVLDTGREDLEYDFEELAALTRTAGGEPVAEFVQRRVVPSVSTYFGKGRAEELYALVQHHQAELVIVNDELTPTQQRNLAEVVHTRVVDRTQLILDIFARRAHTREGKLQVELANLTYTLPRLSNLYTRFERQQGGIGSRGLGEAKLEVDRRHLRSRISELEAELGEVRRQRGEHRRGRQRLPFPTASLVGYTSAGKSTLMNVLSGSEVLVDPMLFATLDPTTRRVLLPNGWAVLLTDTVGFIQRLPHDLVAAFRATLEEVNEADLLIHVVDASHPKRDLQMRAVEDVLAEIGAKDKPIVTAFNKSDRVTDQYELRHTVANTPNSVYISATKRDGLQQLLTTVARVVSSLLTPVEAHLPYNRSELLTQCYESGKVESVEYTPEQIVVKARVTADLAGKMQPYAVGNFQLPASLEPAPVEVWPLQPSDAPDV